MRLIAAALLALAAWVIITTLGPTGYGAAGACTAAGRCGSSRLPAPITITAGQLSYRIARDGHASRISAPRSPYPHDATWFADGSWFRIEHDRLIIGVGRMRLWRSRQRITRELGVVAADAHAVAFQHRHTLYIAPRGGVERSVARQELPLGWTAGGLYTYSYPRHMLLLRRTTGAIVQTIARGPLEYAFDAASRTLYFLRRGVLVGVHGRRVWRLASLRRLGLQTNVGLMPVGGLIELLDNERLAVLRPDGAVFASTSVRHLDRVSSFLAISPSGRTIAFTGLTGPSRHPDAEDVYLLPAGARTATAVHHQLGSFDSCEQWADVEWHGRWLLYSDTSGELAAIDTTGAHHTVELNALARRLLGGRKAIDANWSR